MLNRGIAYNYRDNILMAKTERNQTENTVNV